MTETIHDLIEITAENPIVERMSRKFLEIAFTPEDLQELATIEGRALGRLYAHYGAPWEDGSFEGLSVLDLSE